jgi:phosphatidate cytidylyltransferase
LVEALPAAGISSSALLLVAFPLSFAVRLHGWEREGPRLLLFALVITWAGDTVAYFVGRALGKHPFAPHLSPKKTWEGAVASMAGSVIFGVVYLNRALPAVSLVEAGLLSVVVNIAGQAGDLAESALKRGAGVKDSSSLLPGHGGLLDRVDSSLFALPVVYLKLYLSGLR